MTTAANMSTSVAPRPFYWSVRREIWEHRSVFMGPLIAAGLVLLGTALAHVPGSHVYMGNTGGAPPAIFAMLPFMVAAGIVMITALIVAFAYCLSALNAERRDRSILFWKSLPVSDLTTVLAKAAVPTIIIPVVAFAAILATQLVVLLASATSWNAAGDVISTTLIYGPLVLGLWYAPIYGWLLLVSSWAKRGAFLWGRTAAPGDSASWKVWRFTPATCWICLPCV